MVYLICWNEIQVIGFRRGNARERLVAAALTVLWFTRAPLDPFVRRYIPTGFRFGGWRWNFGPITMVLFGAAAIAIFVRELIEDQREKERLAGELEAGRAMQQVLLGAELPSIPGLRIDSTSPLARSAATSSKFCPRRTAACRSPWAKSAAMACAPP